MGLTSFPRGGKKPDIKPSNVLYSKQTKIKVKKRKSKLKNNTNETLTRDEAIVLNTAENLRLSTLHERMVILGRIYLVTDYYAIVSLPGQISGKLDATNISEAYTNLLQNIANNQVVCDDFKPMTQIYKTGDYVVCYVKALDPDSKSISLSLEPQLINHNLNLSSLTKRSKVAVTIGSVEDYGYTLETGLKNFRAFLSIKDIEYEDSKFYPGKQIICAIKDIKVTENIFTAKTSVKLKHLNIVETNIKSLNSLIPGAQFSLNIKKILNNGLQVNFGEKNIGYVNQLYLQKPLSMFEKEQELIGTLLYIVPTLKFAYFSLLPQEKEKQLLSIGDVVKTKVISHDARGMLLHLKKGVRGYIPYKRTAVDFENIPSIFKVDSTHKCKIIAYDSIAKLYICTMEKKLLEEKHVTNVNLQPGDIVNVTVTNIDQKNGYITVSQGRGYGVVPPDQVSDPGDTGNLKVDQKITARVLEINTSSGKPLFTLKKSLIESKLPILCKEEDAKINSIHHGSVAKITNQGVLIRFFNNIKGWIPKRFLNKQIAAQKWNLTIGQTVTVVIKSINHEENKLTLALFNGKNVSEIKYKIGDVVEGVVTDSSTDGVHLRLKNSGDDDEYQTAFLPAGHMAPCHEVGKLLAAKTVSGDVLSAIVFSTRPCLILSTTFAPEITYKINDINAGNSVLCSVKMIHKESLKVLLPIEKCSKYGTVPVNRVGNIESIYQNQILFGKIISIDKTSKEIILTTQLSKIWKTVADHEIKMMTAVDILSCYLNKVSELSRNVFYTSKAISKINLGQRIKGTVINVVDHGLVVKLEKDVRGIVRTNNFSGKYVQGDEIEGSVLWVNYPGEYVEITLLQHVMNGISVNQKLTKIPIGIQLRGEIVLVTDWFVLVLLKGQGKGTLVSLPARRHLNDVVPDLTPYEIGNKVRCYGVLDKEEADILLPICMLKSAFEIHKSKSEQFEVSSKLKRKIEIADDGISAKKLKNNDEENIKKEINIEINKIKKSKTEVVEKVKLSSKKNEEKSNKTRLDKKKINEEKSNKTRLDTKKIKSVEENVIPKMKVVEQEKEKESKAKSGKLAIPECEFEWDTLTKAQAQEESSSDSGEEAEELPKAKKKKLTPSERRELEQQKERKIREQEEALASCQTPQTVDQFDSLILSSPNSSLVWVQYMAHHLQAAEVEKARALARQALKTINFREEDERLNVWQAWLNLESRFGSPESLNNVFQEATKTNDALKIYTHMLDVHTEAGRQTELEKTVNVMIAKFQQNLEMWVNCGSALLKIGMKDKSRYIMQRALQALPDSKHVNLMVRFAQLENKYGDKERSQTLFEKIISSYPKRTDVLSSYVDSLIKASDVETARRVLDRAITQALPAKKMKVLFKKYISFEHKHGTTENVSRIQELAAKYVEEQCNKVN